MHAKHAKKLDSFCHFMLKLSNWSNFKTFVIILEGGKLELARKHLGGKSPLHGTATAKVESLVQLNTVMKYKWNLTL